MNESRPKVRSLPIASSRPYEDRACVPSTGTAMCADVVSVHDTSGVGCHAAVRCAIVEKKVVAEGMGVAALSMAVGSVFVAGMLIESRRVKVAMTAPETLNTPVG